MKIFEDESFPKDIDRTRLPSVLKNEKQRIKNKGKSKF